MERIAGASDALKCTLRDTGTRAEADEGAGGRCPVAAARRKACFCLHASLTSAKARALSTGTGPFMDGKNSECERGSAALADAGGEGALDTGTLRAEGATGALAAATMGSGAACTSGDVSGVRELLRAGTHGGARTGLRGTCRSTMTGEACSLLGVEARDAADPPRSISAPKTPALRVMGRGRASTLPPSERDESLNVLERRAISTGEARRERPMGEEAEAGARLGEMLALVMTGEGRLSIGAGVASKPKAGVSRAGLKIWHATLPCFGCGESGAASR